MVCFKTGHKTNNPEHYITSRLAPVIVGIKPCVLLRLLGGKICTNTGCSLECWRNNQTKILQTYNLKVMELKCVKNASLLLFYSPELLQNHLSEETNARLLRNFGYKHPHNTAYCLKKLGMRFKLQGCPPETGIFLGYPLKDVLGYLKKESKQTVPNARWCVYGSPDPSVTLMNLHRKAELMFANMLTNNRNPSHYASRLKSHFADKTRKIPHTSRYECPTPCLGNKNHCPLCMQNQSPAP